MFLEVKNLVKYYSKDSPVIKKLNFSVNKGEIISFLGESGSGKTTFLKCISGLEKINSGSISLNNNILNNDSVFVKPQDRKIGFVFQDYPLFPHLNLKENITFNLKSKYFNKLDYMISLTRLEKLLFKEIEPELIFSKPEIHFKNVDFPEPLSPKKDIISPLLTEKFNFFITGESLL